MTMSFQQGQTYEFTFSDGTVRQLRFDGFGEWMQTVWFEPSTQATINQVPPYVSFRPV